MHIWQSYDLFQFYIERLKELIRHFVKRVELESERLYYKGKELARHFVKQAEGEIKGLYYNGIAWCR